MPRITNSTSRKAIKEDAENILRNSYLKQDKAQAEREASAKKREANAKMREEMRKEMDAMIKSKSATKLPTEKRHKSDYKRVKGNIQKSRSDLHVNKKTGKREITTDMVIHKGLTAKEKAGLKKSILKAVKQHLEGSGLHIPLSGGYTSSLIFHEMGKYIPPKDRKLMKKLIEESRPPRPPPIHSGAIDEEMPLAVVPPMDTGNQSASDYESDGTESESDIEPIKYKYQPTKYDSDSDSDDEMFGKGFGDVVDNMFGYDKQEGARNSQRLQDIRNDTARRKAEVLARNAQIEADIKARRAKKPPLGTGVKRPRGRPRKIQL
jgi:hypothetical protein